MTRPASTEPGDLAAFTYITLPLLASIIAVVGLLTTIWTFNNFVYVWLSTRGGPGYFTTVLGTQVSLEAFTNCRGSESLTRCGAWDPDSLEASPPAD